jgi:hypothetical protein
MEKSMKPKLKTRQMTAQDQEEFISHAKEFGSDPDTMRRSFDPDYGKIFVAEHNGKIVGVLKTFLRNEGNWQFTAHIRSDCCNLRMGYHDYNILGPLIIRAYSTYKKLGIKSFVDDREMPLRKKHYLEYKLTGYKPMEHKEETKTIKVASKRRKIRPQTISPQNILRKDTWAQRRGRKH